MGNQACSGGAAAAQVEHEQPDRILSSSVILLSQAQHCPTVLLHLIFSYLPLADRLHAALTCKHWLAAAERDHHSHATLWLRHHHSHTHRDANIKRQTSQPCCFMPILMARSSLRHWVTELIFDHAPYLSLHHLAVALQLPRLRSLSITLDRHALGERMNEAKKQDRPCVLQFPHRLSVLALTLTWSPDAQVVRDTSHLVFDGLSRLSSLHTLLLSLLSSSSSVDFDFVGVDWSPLSALPSLQHLTIHSDYRHESMLLAIKQLSALEELRVYTQKLHVKASWTDPHLKQLCQPPHRLKQLKVLEPLYDAQLSAKSMEQLQHLPALTALHPLAIMSDVLPFLPHFKHLTELSLRIAPISQAGARRDDSSPTYVQDAAHHLAKCPSLISLTLNILVPLNDERISLLLNSLPNICHLHLRTHHPIPLTHQPGNRLECLNGSISERLERLELESGVQLAAVPSLPPLPRLHTLILRTWMYEPQGQLCAWLMRNDDVNIHNMTDEDDGSGGNGSDEQRLRKTLGVGSGTTPRLHTIRIGQITYTYPTSYEG